MLRRCSILAVAIAALSALAAPAAARITFFQTPARNIHCVYLSGAAVTTTPLVRCDTDFPTRFRRKPSNCRFDFGQAFEITTRSHGRAICVSDSADSPSATRLAVGVARMFGTIGCRAPSRVSVRCTSARDHGFLLHPSRQLVY